jgi:hypothetical protein
MGSGGFQKALEAATKYQTENPSPEPMTVARAYSLGMASYDPIEIEQAAKFLDANGSIGAAGQVRTHGMLLQGGGVITPSAPTSPQTSSPSSTQVSPTVGPLPTPVYQAPSQNPPPPQFGAQGGLRPMTDEEASDLSDSATADNASAAAQLLMFRGRSKEAKALLERFGIPTPDVVSKAAPVVIAGPNGQFGPTSGQSSATFRPESTTSGAMAAMGLRTPPKDTTDQSKLPPVKE